VASASVNSTAAAAAQGLHGLQGLAAAAQGLHGFAAAQGLQGLAAAAQGLHGFAAAQGLHGLHAADISRGTVQLVAPTAEAAQGLQGLQAAAQGLHGFAAAQGLQGLHAAAQGLHGFAAAQGLQGLHAAALGLHGLQGLAAAQGLQGLAAAAQGLHGFFAAQGLHAEAMHGLHGFLAAQGLHGLHAPHGVLAPQGLAPQAATIWSDWESVPPCVDVHPATVNPTPTPMIMGTNVEDMSRLRNDILKYLACLIVGSKDLIGAYGPPIRGKSRFAPPHHIVTGVGRANTESCPWRERSPRGDHMAILEVRFGMTKPFLFLMALLATPLAAAAAGAVPPPETVTIPAGSFIVGSDAAEREAAYRLDEAAYGHDITRRQGWYDRERPRGKAKTGAFLITRTPITNAQYAAFVAATGYPAPNVDRATWKGYRLIHPYRRTRQYAWTKGRPPAGKANHPVVLVNHADALAYAAWLSRETGRRWRLPSALEWEKAARGRDGRHFPWGDKFDPKRLNSADAGPFSTTPVGAYPAGASPFGVLDAAGQVYEWTATPVGKKRFIVKGGSWDDKGCSVCRPAAGHSRPRNLKHILIGFRLVSDEPPSP